MADDPRVEQLLDEMIDSNADPEEACGSNPELLPVVRNRWRQMRRLRADLDALFPSAGDPITREDALLASPSKPSPQPLDVTALPRIPGYEVEAVLGRGGMGIVFRARHLRLDRRVALKMALGGAYAGPQDLARFQREAEAVARLRHANVVQIYDIGDADGRPYFTMELVDGGSLAQKLAGTPQPAHQVADLAATLARAVQAAHAAGIVHRDLKPGNVLLTADGTPKISDFGLARRVNDGAGVTQTGVAVGTPSYMAPEQARGRPDAVGPAADVYALGAVLYELLTGRPPFKGETSAETIHQVIFQEPVPPTLLNRKVPRELETICLKCLQKDPQRRYATAADLAGDLLRFRCGEPILARRAGPIERAVKWSKRHRSLAVSLVIGLLLLNLLLGAGAWLFFERTALRRAVNEDLDQVVLAQKEKTWDQARTALERAQARLGDGGPADLRRRGVRLKRELALVGTLEDIFVSTLDMSSAEAGFQRPAARYEQALREAGLVNGPEDADMVAARIRATGISVPLLAALDDWAFDDEGRRDWLYEIARLVDEDPASRQIRDAKLWTNKAALEKFAQSASFEKYSVSFLNLLALNLNALGGDVVGFLKRVQMAHVNDHMANSGLAHVLAFKNGNPAESLRYFQAAIALRPTNPVVRHNLGVALKDLNRWDEALVEFEAAQRLAPQRAWYLTSVGTALLNLKRPAEAERHFRQALEAHPTNPGLLAGLGCSLFTLGQHAEAFDTYQRAIAADPKYAPAYLELKSRYVSLRQWDEVRKTWQQYQTANPTDYEAWDGYAELCLYLGDEADYRRTRTELLKRFANATDPRTAERVGRACLLLPATDAELQQANALIDRAFAVEQPNPLWIRPYFRFAKALSEYRAGRMKNALDLLQGDTLRILPPATRLLLAMVQHRLGQTDAAAKTFNAAVTAFDWDAARATNREAWMFHLLRREAETVLASKP